MAECILIWDNNTVPYYRIFVVVEGAVQREIECLVAN